MKLKNWFAIGHLMELLFFYEWHLMEPRHAEIIPFNPKYMWLLPGRLEILLVSEHEVSEKSSAVKMYSSGCMLHLFLFSLTFNSLRFMWTLMMDKYAECERCFRSCILVQHSNAVIKTLSTFPNKKFFS